MQKGVLDRIDKRLSAIGMTESAAALAAGLSDSAIRNFRRAMGAGKDAGLSTRTLSKLAPVLRTRVAWLVDGIGPEDVSDVVDAIVLSVPLISWVSAGALARGEPVHAEDLDSVPRIHAPDLDPNGDWIALRVDGDSMNRISPHNSIIFVNRRDRKLVPNACYIIGDGEGGATYKRYRPPTTWEPVSTNPVHQPFHLPDGTAPDIIGRVRKTVLEM